MVDLQAMSENSVFPRLIGMIKFRYLTLSEILLVNRSNQNVELMVLDHGKLWYNYYIE